MTKKKKAELKTKKKQKGESNPNGRPTIMTAETVKKLEEGFAQGFSVDNACIWANISKQTFYTYCEKNAGFLDHCHTLQKKPLIKSIIVINKALNEGDVSTAKWYAERKCKDEFSLKTETEHSGQIQSKVVYIEKEEKEAYEQHINKIIEDAD